MIFDKADRGKLNFINLELSQMTDDNSNLLDNTLNKTQNSQVFEASSIKIKSVHRQKRNGPKHKQGSIHGVGTLNISFVEKDDEEKDELLSRNNPIKVESNNLKTDRPSTNEPIFKRTLGGRSRYNKEPQTARKSSLSTIQPAENNLEGSS